MGLELLKYIEAEHPAIRNDLVDYINSDRFSEDVDRVLSVDNTINRVFAGQCAIEQFIDEI